MKKVLLSLAAMLLVSQAALANETHKVMTEAEIIAASKIYLLEDTDPVLPRRSALYAEIKEALKKEVQTAKQDTDVPEVKPMMVELTKLFDKNGELL